MLGSGSENFHIECHILVRVCLSMSHIPISLSPFPFPAESICDAGLPEVGRQCVLFDHLFALSATPYPTDSVIKMTH